MNDSSGPATPGRVRGLGTALITGPTAGIGYAFAVELASRGHDLVLVARDTERLLATAAELTERYGIAVEVITADLADRAGVDSVAERLAVVPASGEDRRPIDLLVNNAGFGLKKPFAEASLAEEQAMLDVLVTAVMRLSHAALQGMLQRGHGGILNVSSVAAYLDNGTYSAAKAWVNSFTRWAAAQYVGSGVQVMALCPGYVRTEFHQRMGVRRQGAPDYLWLDATEVVREALADFEHGRVISVPSKRYKAITAVARAVPAGLQQRLLRRGAK